MHGVCVGVVGVGMVLAVLLNVLIARLPDQDEKSGGSAKEAASGDANNSGRTNVHVVSGLNTEDAVSLDSFKAKF